MFGFQGVELGRLLEWTYSRRVANEGVEKVDGNY